MRTWRDFNDQFRETTWERNERLRKRRLQKAADPRDPDYSRPGIFATHNCWKCSDGAKPCVQGGPHRCEYPHARND